MKLQEMFSSRKSSNVNDVISCFEGLASNLRKYNDLHFKAFLSLQNWASTENNCAIQDISSKLMSLSFKLNNELNDDKIVATKEIVHLFKRIKEYEAKKTKLAGELRDAEKQVRKREDELSKCPLSKNILDYEARVYKARNEREKIQLKYYELSNEMEATKLIMFKKNFLKYNELLIKHNQAENILLGAMQELVMQIPDIVNEDLNEMSYDKHEVSEKILDEAKENLNTLAKQKSFIKNETQKNALQKRSQTFIKHKPKLKSRISCPSFAHANSTDDKIFPSLSNLALCDPPTYSDSERTKNSISSIKYTAPSAPPLNEINERENYQCVYQLNGKSKQ